jgi:heat shock protein HslJ
MDLIRISRMIKPDRFQENVGDSQSSAFVINPCQWKSLLGQRCADEVDKPSNMLIMWMLCVAIIAMGGISNARATVSLASLEGTWHLVSIDSRPLRLLPTDQVPYIKVKGMAVTGYDGCNNFYGRIDLPGNISSTRLGCLEETIKLPLDLGDLPSHLQAGTIDKNILSVPARNHFPASRFEHTD